jgi:hypothetical protein
MSYQSLHDTCNSYLLHTKWLLAPSRRTGHQWIDTLVRGEQSVVNLHPTTIVRLALELIGHELVAQRLTLANRNVASLAIDTNWNVLSDNGYLGKLRRSFGLSDAVCDSLLSLRLAGYTAERIETTHFESAAKANDVKHLLNAYENFLKTHALLDEADVLKRATISLREQCIDLSDDTLVLLPEGMQLATLEQQFVDALPSTVLINVQHPAGPRSA